MWQEKLGVADSCAFGQIFVQYLQKAAPLSSWLGGSAFIQIRTKHQGRGEKYSRFSHGVPLLLRGKPGKSDPQVTGRRRTTGYSSPARPLPSVGQLLDSLTCELGAAHWTISIGLFEVTQNAMIHMKLFACSELYRVQEGTPLSTSLPHPPLPVNLHC